MAEPRLVAEARRALGRKLSAYRKAAGCSQHQLAVLVHQSRGSVANIETGRQHASKRFWIDADRVLSADGALLENFDKLQALIRDSLRKVGDRKGRIPRARGVRRTGLATRRTTRGHSQESLASVLGVERSTVARWEAGGATPLPWVRPKLAHALALSPERLAALLGVAEHAYPGGDTTAGREGLHQVEAITAQLPGIRRVLDAHDLPPDGPVRPLGDLHEVVSAVVNKRLHSNYLTLAYELPDLLAELMRALLGSRAGERSAVARLLVQAYRAADAVADKFGHYDLSARIIDRMRWAAVEAGDELLIATASYVRAETFFANGDLETGRRMLESAAARVNPGRSVQASATCGSLHMRAAVAAARAGNPFSGREHLAEAVGLAKRTPERVYFGTAFGPASVRIHQLSLAVELADPGAALRTSRHWAPPPSLPAERRSHFYVDLARAQMQAGHTDDVLESLMTARSIAPEHIQSHPQVRGIVDDLSRTAVEGDARLAALAEFVALPQTA